MKTGKITAKLRDAVPVCLMVNGEEVKRYKNIELPDMLKEVEIPTSISTYTWTGKSPLKSTMTKVYCRRYFRRPVPE